MLFNEAECRERYQSTDCNECQRNMAMRRWPLDKRISEPSQSDDRASRSCPIEPAFRILIPHLRHKSTENHYDCCQRQIQKKHPTPTVMFNQPSAGYRSNCSCDCRKSRPGSNRPSSFAFGEVRRYERETSWNQQSRSDTLDRPRDDQPIRILRQTTRHRRDRKQKNSADVDLSPAVAIPDRTADQEQRRQCERIGFYDPLHNRYIRGICFLQIREGKVDDGSVEKCHA